MVSSKWMHEYMRMYRAKKILECSPSAREEYDICVRLNDWYELDGRDPMVTPASLGQSASNTTVRETRAAGLR